MQILVVLVLLFLLARRSKPKEEKAEKETQKSVEKIKPIVSPVKPRIVKSRRKPSKFKCFFKIRKSNSFKRTQESKKVIRSNI